MAIIEVKNVSKVYPGRQGAKALLGRGGIASWIRPGKKARFEALKDVTLEVHAGESLGIIGRNGSGKSTLLKILAGVTLPTTGTVTVRGRVASLLELGAGFHPMLTGRENIYLNAGLLGMRHREVDKVFDSIVAFSGIAAFIDQPVDTYSSGMYVRIAFAVAVHVNPDIFLVDEVLSVGDEEFQRRCRTKIGELREQGKTIVFVSHDLGTVSALCERVVLLADGQMVTRQTPQQTIEYYLRQVGQASGIHTLRNQDTEVLFNHGRIAVFHQQTEITASSGLKVQFHTADSVHESDAAIWTLRTKTEVEFEAEAELPRLSILLRYRMKLEETRLLWRIGIVCTKPTRLDRFVTLLAFPLHYANWIYDDRKGAFPALQPADIGHTVIVPPVPDCRDTALVPDSNDPQLPSVSVQMEPVSTGWNLHLANSDFATGARVVTVHRQFPTAELPLEEGAHDLVAISVELVDQVRLDEIQEELLAVRSVQVGDMRAYMRRGSIELSWKGVPITKDLHLHTQIYLGQVWLMSQALRWHSPVRQGNAVTADAESPRFPLRQRWSMEPAANGIQLHVWLQALEPLRIEEFNVSSMLDTGFSHWRTEHEQGDFPAFTPGVETWVHLNRHYKAGRQIIAEAPGRPRVHLEFPPQDRVFRLSPLNTGYSQQGRVLQAIHLPERAGAIEFAAGSHHLLSVEIMLRPRGDEHE